MNISMAVTQQNNDKTNMKISSEGSIFAGNVGIKADEDDKNIEDIKTMFHKNAMRTIMKQCEKDNEMTSQIEKSHENMKTYEAEIKEANETLNSLMQLKEEQGADFDMDADITHFSDIANNAAMGIRAENQAIYGVKSAMDKQHGMIDADKQADEIMSQGSKMVIGSMIADTVAQINENFDENKQKADDDKEEEDIPEQSKNNDSEQQEEISAVDKMVKDIKEYVRKENLIDDDAQGIIVDQEI